MAGGLESLASYVAKMLADMAKEEISMLIGVPGEIKDLDVKLNDLQNVLADADRRNIIDKSVHGWVDELKCAMYEATDILDLCQLKVMEEGPSKNTGCFNALLFCMRNPLHAHEIGIRIKELNNKLDGICTRGRSFNFIKLEAYQGRRATHTLPIGRKTHPVLERSSVVGEKIEEDTRELVEKLTKELGGQSDNIKVFAIVGVGGIGKTTLSKKVFNDEVIGDKFAKKIWLSITREFNEVDLLRTAITAVEENLPQSRGGSQDESLLVPDLTKAITDKKIFLVLDDMWGTDAWTNLLKEPFSHGAPGSRVLITSRREDVARGMRAEEPYYHIDKLGSEDAWSLLKKQIVTNEKSEAEVDMLKDIGLQIISKCDGLPLAVKVLGGLLCQRKKERRDWEKVLNDTIWSTTEMPVELNNAIYLSYEDLDPWLKQCFLHFSLKPKKSKSISKSVLETEELVAMWISEGFVYGDSDRLEEIGTEYHEELIMRNLIEPDTDYNDHDVCNMHDVVRSFAQFLTRGEALVAHNGENIDSKLKVSKFLRLSIKTKAVESEEFNWTSLREQKSLRFIIFSGNLKIQPSDSFITFSSLRTLHIEYTKIAPLVVSLHQLKHLRYLAVENCTDIYSLPEDIYMMKFLQYISLEGCENLHRLPDSIVNLRELRYLKLVGTGVDSMPRGFCALTNLRSLYGFPSSVDDDWCNLEELGPLSYLRCIHLVGLGDVSAPAFATKARLGEKMHLTSIELDCGSQLDDEELIKARLNEQNQGIIEKVLDELYPPPYLENISIQGFFGRQLPKWMMWTTTTSLGSLKNLHLGNLSCCTQLPDGLCQLPCLEYLDVYHAPAIKRVGPEFSHPYSECHRPSSQGVVAFPKLKRMELERIVQWEEWEWKEEVQAMLVLEELSIEGGKLVCLPPGLSFHATSLKKLTIWEVKGLQSLENFASVVELDMYDLPKLTRISNFPKLLKLEIDLCPKLSALQEMSALRSLVLSVDSSVTGYKKRLPLYLRNVQPNHLLLECSVELIISMATGKSGRDWDRFNHIQHVEAYADEEDGDNKRYMSYTRDPFSIETSIKPNLEDQSEGDDESDSYEDDDEDSEEIDEVDEEDDENDDGEEDKQDGDGEDDGEEDKQDNDEDDGEEDERDDEEDGGEEDEHDDEDEDEKMDLWMDETLRNAK